MTIRDSYLIGVCFDALFRDDTAKSVTAFCPRNNCSKHRVRVTKNRKHGRYFRVTIGPPNYAEREFLKQCRKAKAQPKKIWISKRFKG